MAAPWAIRGGDSKAKRAAACGRWRPSAGAACGRRRSGRRRAACGRRTVRGAGPRRWAWSHVRWRRPCAARRLSLLARMRATIGWRNSERGRREARTGTTGRSARGPVHGGAVARGVDEEARLWTDGSEGRSPCGGTCHCWLQAGGQNFYVYCSSRRNYCSSHTFCSSCACALFIRLVYCSSSMVLFNSPIPIPTQT